MKPALNFSRNNVDDTNLQKPIIPIHDLDEMDIESLFSSHSSRPSDRSISGQSNSNIELRSYIQSYSSPLLVSLDSFKQRAKIFYKNHTIASKVFAFIFYYLIGIIFYTSRERWGIVGRWVTY